MECVISSLSFALRRFKSSFLVYKTKVIVILLGRLHLRSLFSIRLAIGIIRRIMEK